MPKLANASTPASSWQGFLVESAAEALGDFADCEFFWIAMVIAVVAILLYALLAALWTSEESKKMTIVKAGR